VIVISLLLVIGSAVLLVAGLANADHLLIWASIGASLGAALALTISVLRRRVRATGDAAAPPGQSVDPLNALAENAGRHNADSTHHADSTPHAESGPAFPGLSPPADVDDAPTVIPPPQLPAEANHRIDHNTGDRDVIDPPDEPAEEDVSAPDALRVVDLLDEVMVVDGRPRYHLPDCAHLAGRDAVPLTISEAREAGFTPCSLCKPDSTLAESSRRSAGR